MKRPLTFWPDWPEVRLLLQKRKWPAGQTGISAGIIFTPKRISSGLSSFFDDRKPYYIFRYRQVKS